MPVNKVGTVIGGLSGIASGLAQTLDREGTRRGNRSFFNIERFKSELSTQYGLFRPTLFYVDIGVPPFVTKLTNAKKETAPGYTGKGVKEGKEFWLQDPKERLRFLCSSASLPGVQILTSDHRRQNMGVFDRRPFGVQVTDIPLTFMLDGRGFVLKFFNQWANAIVNADHRNGELGETALEHGLYEIGYRDSYITDVKITTLTGTQDPDIKFVGDEAPMVGGYKYPIDRPGQQVEIATYTLNEAFPIQIGDVSVAWNAENQFSTLPIQFTFRGYSLDQLPTGKTTTARSFSMSEWIGILGSVVNLGSQIYSNPPNSIGSALNVLTNTALFAGVTRRAMNRLF